jgi:hypothetical protein
VYFPERRAVILRRRFAVGAVALTAQAVLAACGDERRSQTEPTRGGWEKYSGNPVLGGALGTCFDAVVRREVGRYRMWFSWRPHAAIALVESDDGTNWSAPQIVLQRDPQSRVEREVNRPSIAVRDGVYHRWFTSQSHDASAIAYATSRDGRTFERVRRDPVLAPRDAWEGRAVMAPHVLWDDRSGTWRMWYSGGGQVEPNAIGSARSADGVTWERDARNPILTPNDAFVWERSRVAAAQIVLADGAYYAFYIGFSDLRHASIGLARSHDGTTRWERHPLNPLISPTPGGWDGDACYKPFALRELHGWRLWYNGRLGSVEQIGIATHRGDRLWA